MNIAPYTAAEFAEALGALLPPGPAWEWRQAGGLGPALLQGPAVELARVDAPAVAVLGHATAAHTPMTVQWRLADYQAVATRALASALVSTRRPLVAGARVGQRVWSGRARYVLVVTYSGTLAQGQALRQALAVFKQAHMVVFYAAQSGERFAELSDA